MDTNILYIKSVSVWWCFYILNNTLTRVVPKIMKQHLGWVEKRCCLYKKACIILPISPLKILKKKAFLKDDDFSTECRQLTGMSWHWTLDNKTEALHFWCPKWWMSLLWWEPRLALSQCPITTELFWNYFSM